MKPETRGLARFAEAQAAERLKTLAANLRKAGKHPGQAGPIHDLRVSVRRFTQALRVFKDLWDHRHYRTMRRRLRKLMDLCGAVRNCDVAIEILDTAGVPAAGDVKTYLRKRRSRAERDLSEELVHWLVHWNVRGRYKATARSWSGWLSVQAAKHQSTQSRARQILGPLTKEYLKVGSHAAQPETGPDELHKLRLMAKRLRYSLEIFGALSGAQWKQEIERIRGVQELLGAINDCVTTSGLVAECGRKVSLKRLLNQRLEAFRGHWRKVYHSIDARKMHTEE